MEWSEVRATLKTISRGAEGGMDVNCRSARESADLEEPPCAFLRVGELRMS